MQVESSDSLENVETKWISEIKEHCPNAKIVLVALKCDLREELDEKDNNGEPVPQPKQLITYQQGLAVAKRIGALRYLGLLSPLHLQAKLLY